MNIQSVFKGEADEKINAKLFRYPTKEEVTADLGDDGIRALLFEKLKAVESGMFIPVQNHHYLVYLKHSEEVHYAPLYGSHDLDFVFLELSPSFAHKDEKIDDSKD